MTFKLSPHSCVQMPSLPRSRLEAFLLHAEPDARTKADANAKVDADFEAAGFVRLHRKTALLNTFHGHLSQLGALTRKTCEGSLEGGD